MTVIRGGVGDIWHMYQKDTGKGRNVIVRKANSAQSSPTLRSWKQFVADQARAGNLTKRAKEMCIQEAEDLAKKDPTALQRYFRTYNTEKNIKICKMSVLRKFLHDALKAIAESPNRPPESKSTKLAAAGGAAGGGKAAEVRGVWL